MKLLNLLFITIILTVFILAGCSSEDDELLVPNDGGGFASLSPGSWEELTTNDGNRERYEYIGVDTYNGTECYVLEFDTIDSGKKSVSQIWINKASSQGVLMVMKDENGKVTKMDIPQNYEPPTGSGGEVPTNSTKLGDKKYTTPTGKTVDAVAYKTTTPLGEVESWSSSQVPFGEVKTITNGQVTSELYDFGTSGAIRDISKQEAENAKPFSIGDIDSGGDQGGDIGGGGQVGDIVITVGAGGRPDIKVSKPIISLMVAGVGVAWGFNFNDGSSAGPFKYGTVPNNAELFGVANPPDLVAGSIYTIQAQGLDDSMGQLVFAR